MQIKTTHVFPGQPFPSDPNQPNMGSSPKAPVAIPTDVFEASEDAPASPRSDTPKPALEAPSHGTPSRLQRSWSFVANTARAIGAQATQAFRLLANAVWSMGESAVEFVTSSFNRSRSAENVSAEADMVADDAALEDSKFKEA